MSLPAWIEKEWKKRTPKENVEHPDWRLFQALAIAWEALRNVEKDPVYGDVTAKDAMRRIEELGAPKFKIEKVKNPSPRYISEDDI